MYFVQDFIFVLEYKISKKCHHMYMYHIETIPGYNYHLLYFINKSSFFSKIYKAKLYFHRNGPIKQTLKSEL